MKVEIVIDRATAEVSVAVRAPAMSEEVREVARCLEEALVLRAKPHTEASYHHEPPPDGATPSERGIHREQALQRTAPPPHHLDSVNPAGFNRIIGYGEDQLHFIEQGDILRFEAQNQKVFAHTAGESVRVKQRLYELEDVLRGSSFVRVSNSEIVNFDKVAGMDLSIAGILVLKFKTGGKSYVSRRYVKRIKEYLGL